MVPLESLNNYRGDAALAGGTSGVGGRAGVYEPKYSWDAMDKFTQLSFNQNRDIWWQKNQEAQKNAAEAAKALNVDYGNLIEEDKKVVDEKLNALLKYYNENPGSAVRTFDSKNGKDNAESYTKFVELSKELNYAIGRGNLRAEQLKQVQDDMSKVTDPNQIKKYSAWVDSERTKPIYENILLMPPLDQFNLSKYVDEISKNAKSSYGYVKILDNNNVEVTRSVVDPDKALSQAYIDVLSDDPTKQELKGEVMRGAANFNTIVQKFKGANGVIDLAKMKSSPDGKMIADMVDSYNEYISMLNNSEMVEGVAGSTKKKVYESLGYETPLEGINISDGIDWQEFLKMGMVGKLTNATKADVQFTGSANNRLNSQLDYKAAMARLAFDKEQVASGAKSNKSIADEVNQMWYNIMTLPGSGAPEISPGKYDLPVTPQLQNAFTKNLGKEVTTTSSSGLGSNKTSTVEKTSEKIPSKMYVVKGADQNSSKIEIEYNDGSKETISGNTLYNNLNNIYGNTNAPKVSQAKIEFMQKSLKTTSPDVSIFEKYYGNTQPTPDNPNKPTNTPSPAGVTELPTTNGKVDPKKLTKGTIYNYQGKKYQWNGTKLVPVK